MSDKLLSCVPEEGEGEEGCPDCEALGQGWTCGECFESERGERQYQEWKDERPRG